MDIVRSVEVEVVGTWNFEIAERLRQRGDEVFRKKLLLHLTEEDFEALMKEVKAFKAEKEKIHNDVRIDPLRVGLIRPIYAQEEEESVTNN